MNRIAFRAWIVGILALVLSLGFVLFIVEYVLHSPQWLVSENSPLVDNRNEIEDEERALDYGIIQDMDGEFLLDLSQNRVYSQDVAIRKSTLHWLGGRNGNISAPLFANYKEQMLGYDVLSGTYTYGDTVPVTQLTFSAQVQKTALEALGSRKGTVAVYNYKTGRMLCAVTTPTFDPDNIPEDLESDPATNDAYYNKFIQYTYAPGSIFKIVTLAAAIEELEDLQSMTFDCTGSYQMGVDKVTCSGTHGKQNIQEAFRNSCNCAFAQLSETLGTENLAKYVEQFGITDRMTVDGMETAAGRFDTDPSAVNVAWSAIGQFTDQVNPCAFLSFVGAIARDGQGLQPFVLDRVSLDGKTTYKGKALESERIMSEETAKLIQEYMRSNVADKYGDWNFPGLTACAKTGTAEVGGDKKPHAMLTGFVTDPDYPLAFIICVENAGSGASVCLPIASQVLAACKTVLDS